MSEANDIPFLPEPDDPEVVYLYIDDAPNKQVLNTDIYIEFNEDDDLDPPAMSVPSTP
jgi:hypothetical protein